MNPFDTAGIGCQAVLAHLLNRPLLLDPSTSPQPLSRCTRRVGRATLPVGPPGVGAVAAHRGSAVDVALAALVAAYEGRPLLLLDPDQPPSATVELPAIIIGGLTRLPTSIER